VADGTRKRGQALVEFAIALPILILLVAGVLELSRGYAVAVATSNAARDGARYAAGKTAATNGPGLANMCSLVKADLVGVTTNVVCPTQINHPPPFTIPTDYSNPTGGQALVLIYCGSTVDCTGTAYTLYQSRIDVFVYYGFDDLNLFGGRITISGSGKAITSW